MEQITLDELPEVLEVDDIKKFLKVNRTAAYDLVKSGQFRVIRIGRIFKIPKKNFVAWFEGHNSAS